MILTTLKWRHVAILAAAMLLAGCNKDAASAQAEAEKKLAEAQAQLEEAQKAIESAKQTADAERKVAEAQTQLAQAKKNLVSAQQKATGSKSSGTQTPAPTPTPPPAPKTYTLPVGSAVVVRTTSAISTKTSQSGDAFEATLHQPLEVDGYVIAPKGATVHGVVSNSDPGGRVKGVASLALALRAVTLQSGETIDLATDSVSKLAPQSKKKDALKVGIASGVGAAIGAIAGGGKGAAIGAGAGAAGGTGVVLATRGEAATIASESVLTFQTTAPVTVTAKK